jgi:hypothetical protein
MSVSGEINHMVVIPAQAGIYCSAAPCCGPVDPGLRRGDDID